ncbi:MAG: T9SS type A sorting domain-containing protein [Adhaeribacter sp.]
MKRIILIFYCVLSCSLSWAQRSEQPEVPKPKAPQSQPVSRAPDAEPMRVVLYPNPGNGMVHITLTGFKGKKTELRIMNVIGNVVYREILSDPDERFTKTIDLTKSANGLYYVKLETEDFSEIRKIIIQ